MAEEVAEEVTKGVAEEVARDIVESRNSLNSSELYLHRLNIDAMLHCHTNKLGPVCVGDIPTPSAQTC